MRRGTSRKRLGEIPQPAGVGFRLRGEARRAIFVSMNLVTPGRLRRLALWPLVLGLAGAGCYDTPTGTGTKLRLVEPLTMTWRGKANGDGYHLETATFSAAMNLRATWHFRIESSSGALFTQDGQNQDRIEFTWKGIADSPYPPDPQFGYDQHCVVTLSFDVLELDPRDAAKAQVSFDIVR